MYENMHITATQLSLNLIYIYMCTCLAIQTTYKIPDVYELITIIMLRNNILKLIYVVNERR